MPLPSLGLRQRTGLFRIDGSLWKSQYCSQSGAETWTDLRNDVDTQRYKETSVWMIRFIEEQVVSISFCY